MTRLAAGGLSAVLFASLAQAGPISEDAVRQATADIDGEAIIANARTTENWLNYGLDYAETRFSRLESIDEGNVDDLGLAWSYNLNSTRGVEATPIVVDGVMYVTASWSVVHALDAVTGEQLWVYDPQVPKSWGVKGCCDVVNRGVAVHEGKVYVGAFDGYLHAIDAATGERIWKVNTLIDRDRPYTITGAPRVVKGNVLIGNGGAELGVRGYVTAYDAETGEQAWRWFSVPGNPDEPFEDASMEAAAKTWDPSGKYWEAGGGGTIWDAMAYDPELDLLYVGTGNGSPWNRKLRSPSGGDNLYLASVVALDPDTGEYQWHYQHTPGDTWDYTSTQHIILADLDIDGETRKVLLQAPKNGFFYVIDRTDGEFISAEPFVKVTWAKGYDEDGRPIEVEGARSRTDPWETVPSPYGAHNWHPMSYNPRTGLVYIPAQGVPLVLQHNPAWELNKEQAGAPASGVGWNLGYFFASGAKATPFGHLLAWDPVKQEEVWRSEYVSPWNGGTLTTAGNLVFQGTADGRFIAYNASTGKMLWQTPVGSGVVAAPATWEHEGEQYVTVAVGWGGVYGITQRATDRVGPGRVYTFKMGGEAEMPEMVIHDPSELVKGVPYEAEHVEAGGALYVANCLMCHGVPGVNNGGNVSNLGYSDADTLKNAEDIVFTDAMADQGMPNFKGELTEAELTRIIAFIQGTVDAVRQQ
ncbi:PQQ-dependent dehydrogenase, methanol/ethanol family [Ectothiorhodospiraceae bacterium WFHF3C12]|nr:PQQ-dependent dehydrogenase, methanol/ethanol family [Ectothiorhodospiraceae bacterium WFHF3C12]